MSAYTERSGSLYREINWLITDHLGTPRMIAERTGKLEGIKRSDYLPFGEQIQAGVGGRSQSQGYVNESVRQGFTGHEEDTETGLTYAQARYLSSGQGRFISVDPLMASAAAINPKTWNRYVYVSNNPLRFNDPTGMFQNPSQQQQRTSVTVTECEDVCPLPIGEVRRQRFDDLLRPRNPFSQPGSTVAGALGTAAPVAPKVINISRIVGKISIAGRAVGGGAAAAGGGSIAAPAAALAGGVIIGGLFLDRLSMGPFLPTGRNPDGSFSTSVGPQAETFGPGDNPISPQNDQQRPNEPFLVRFGDGPETAQELGAQAAKAEADGFPHGVSTRLKPRISGSDLRHRFAPLSAVQMVFEVRQTGNDPRHYTVILPNPVTDAAAAQFNSLFKPSILRPRN
jgi:RHS repeat-associated protein